MGAVGRSREAGVCDRFWSVRGASDVRHLLWLLLLLLPPLQLTYSLWLT